MQHLEPDIDALTPETGREVEDLEIASTHRDTGSTLLELLIVIVILGVLLVAVMLGLTGMHSQAAETTCGADERQLQVAAEAYFAQVAVGTIPATGSGPDRYQQTLVDGGFLRHVSEFHDLDAAGVTIPKAGSQC